MTVALEYGAECRTGLSVREFTEWFAERLGCEMWEDGFARRGSALHIVVDTADSEEYGQTWEDLFGTEPFITATFRLPRVGPVERYNVVKGVFAAMAEFFATHPDAFGYFGYQYEYILLQRFEGEPITFDLAWKEYAGNDEGTDHDVLDVIAAPYTTAPIHQIWQIPPNPSTEGD